MKNRDDYERMRAAASPEPPNGPSGEVSVTLEFMGKTKMDKAKIQKLTGKELVLEKEGGKVDEYRRKKK